LPGAIYLSSPNINFFTPALRFAFRASIWSVLT
jgi:hypothetical protein